MRGMNDGAWEEEDKQKTNRKTEKKKEWELGGKRGREDGRGGE